jgi:hypothetical protein
MNLSSIDKPPMVLLINFLLVSIIWLASLVTAELPPLTGFEPEEYGMFDDLQFNYV